MSPGLLVLLGGIVVTGAAWLLDRRRRAYTDRATTPAAAVFAGRNEVKGRAWAEAPLTAHRTQLATVWWDYQLEEERTHTRTVTSTDSKGNTQSRTETYQQWHDIDARSGALPSFEVVDATGSVTVRLAGARVVPREVHRDVFKDTRDDRGFLGKLFDNRTGRYRETERAVVTGDTLFVVGEAQLDAETATPVLAGGPLVSTRSEASHTGRLGAAVVVLVLVAAGALGMGTALALAGPTDPSPVEVAVAVAVPALALLVAWTVTTYNRLHLMAQSIRRAWSLIDVQLARRHDLVPALARAVAAHAAHERSVLEAVTLGRWEAGEDRHAPELSREASQQTAALQQVLARAEAYPQLAADASFQQLQRTLADTESRIAASRTFYNDTLTLLRTLAHSFPAVLVARFLQLEQHELLAADGFERTVPAIEHTFT
ncbi:MAG: LemA family protein [Acidimicrobiales bacterium]